MSKADVLQYHVNVHTKGRLSCEGDLIDHFKQYHGLAVEDRLFCTVQKYVRLY